MAKDDLSGKLAVILHADVVGSTQLVQQDEQLAHERIQDAFRRFSDTIEKYHGRVQELRGDALLAEFERASDAVTAALAFQSDHDDRLVMFNDNIQPKIRVGIALGEVVIADNTVTGAGVVLAQRIEQLAEPGGLCITSAIHEALPNRMPFSMESLGEQALKGFDEPVRVYRVQLSTGESAPPPQQKSRQKVSSINLRQMIIVAGVVVLIAAGIGYWSKNSLPQEETASIERMAHPIPDRPSIAVLPFTNISDLAEQEFFADGMTDDLITDLSKVSGLFVIARNSVFTYKDKAVKVRQVAEELGVRYVMEGSVQRAGNQIRINAQLIDATTGGHVWAERYDGTLDDVFAMRDEISRRIVTALSVTLVGHENSSRGQVETNSPEAYDAFLRGWAHYRLSTPNDSVKAISYLKNAIELDPNFGRAHAALAATYWRIYDNNWAISAGVSYSDALEQTNRYLEEALKDPTPLAHRTAAKQYFYFRRWDEAMMQAERAIAMDPNDPSGYEAMGTLLVNLGRAAEGLDFIKKAMRLDPQSDYLYRLGEAQFHLERYDEAAATMLRATKLNPDDGWNYFLLAATYGHLGHEQEAKSAIIRFNKTYHDPTDKQRPLTLADLDTWIFKEPANRDRLKEGLRKAGVPVGAPANPADSKYQELITVSAGIFNVEGAIDINAAEAKSLHDRGIVFIDSRGSVDFGRGHIPGATNLLFHKVWDNLPQIVDLDEEVVFYCGGPDCHLSANSSAQALILGYTKVYYFAGGFSAWEDAGYPVEVN
jgi:TolB-like protein/class 3 adenylate cyclase/rhodanese-related sulfurtransferase/Flp pilus assembly protein TadD